MTTINLQETHTRRVEWVQSSIMGLFDLPHRPEKYNTPRKVGRHHHLAHEHQRPRLRR